MTSARRGATGIACSLVVVLGGCRSRAERGARLDAPVGRTWTTPPLDAVDGGPASQKLPRVIYQGGPFLRNPRLVTITFRADDPSTADRLEKFGDVITATPWWREVVDAYCVKDADCIGEGSSQAHVRLDEHLPSSVRDTDVDAVLERAIASGRVDVNAKDSLLLVYLPPGVTLSDAYVSKYCAGGPRAFHRALAHDKRRVPYAVIPRCGDIDDTTNVGSHELVEAVTNPDPTRRGFAFEGGAASQAFVSAGLEPVDPCGLVTRDRHRTAESGFVVQRAWSNRAASLGRDPCVPAPPLTPYRALVPEAATVRLSKDGDETTMSFEAVADGEVAPWAVSAVDLTGEQNGTRYVEVTLDRATVTSGERGALKVKRLRKGDSPLVIVGLVSRDESGDRIWPVAVVFR